ncbi:MAG: hypothetical protein ACW981_00540 [Candidatus Hodarchaeales archaeon]|jgi:hypothetical protein
MAIFEVFNWTTIPQLATEHEAVIDKYMFVLKLLKTKIGKLISLRYFSQAYGGDNSPLGGRTLMLEYENFKEYEEFQEELAKREDYQGFQQAWGKLIIPSSLRASIMTDRARNSWFSGNGTEINGA